MSEEENTGPHDIQDVVEILLRRAASAKEANVAMKFSQAALNAAHSMLIAFPQGED